MFQIDRDLAKMIERELEQYQVSYSFKSGGKHPLVEIEPEGCDQSIRVSFSRAPANPRVVLNIKSNIRKALRDAGVKPKWKDRTSPIGDALLEAANDGAESDVKVETAPKRKRLHLHNDDLPDPILFPELPLYPDAIREAAKPIKSVASVPAPTQTKEANTMLAKTETTPAPATDTRQFVKMLNSEITQTTRMLCTHATIDDDEKLVTYAEGWSDERIHSILTAVEGRENLKLQTIQDWRRREFGMTTEERDRANAAKQGPAVVAETTNRLKIEALEKSLADLTARVFAIEEAATRPA